MDTINVQEKQQEAFNKVWNHFVVNKGPLSFIQGAICMYRLDKTAACPIRCAVGVLMPDEEYDPEFDNGMIQFYDVVKAVKAFEGLDVSFLRSLQIPHDRACGAPDPEHKDEYLEQRYRQIAEAYFLTVPNDNAG